jgi:hypothetical protein
MAKRLSENVRRFFTFLVVTMLMLGSVAAPGRVAAQAQTVQSQLTGVTISYGPPYVLAPDLGFYDQSVEMIGLTGAADILMIGFMSPLIDLTAARDTVLEGLFSGDMTSANIDRGSYTGVSYSLDMLNLDGDEMGVFTLFMNQRSHGQSEFYIFIAPPALFGGTMASAQNSVSVNGARVLDGIDATTMGNMVMANVGITGGTAVTDVTEVTETGTTGTTQTTTTGTTQTTTTGTTQTTGSTEATTGDPDARKAYLDAVLAEYNNATAQLGSFLETFNALSNKEVTGEQAAPILDNSMANLAGTNDRVAAIQPPAGMESFHQEFLAWSDAMTNVGVQWNNFRQQSATGDDHFNAMSAALEIHETFGASLDAEMSAAPAQTTGTSQTTTTGSTQTTGTEQTSASTGDNAEYLAAVRAEYEVVTVQLVLIVSTVSGMNEGSITSEQGVADLNDANLELVASAERSAAIQPPAGMEAFHEQFLAWNQAVADTGAAWVAVTQGGEVAAWEDALNNLIRQNEAFGTALEAEEASSSSSGTTTTETTGTTSPAETTGNTGTTGTTGTTGNTRTTRTTGTTQTTASTGGNEDYLAAVRAEYEIVGEQMTVILDTLDQMGAGTIAAEQGRADIEAANQELAASAQRTAALQPPSGMEDFHQSVMAWQESVQATADAWVVVTQGGDSAEYVDAFNAMADQQNILGPLLEAEEAGSGSSGTTTTGTTSTTGSTRTTRSTGSSSETPAATEATGTTGSTRSTRTTRSTGTASETPTATETTGSTRSTRSTGTTNTTSNTGNSSETSGNAGTTGTSSSGGDSWLTPQNNLTITWNEPFLLDERDEDLPMESDESDGTDILRLYWVGSEGQEVGVFVTVYPITEGDASDRVALFTDPAVLVDTFGEGTELIDSVSAPEQGSILARLDVPNADIWVYMQYTCADPACSQLISVMIVTSGANMSAVLADMEQSVDVEGMPISNAMTPADVQTAIDAAGP